MRIWTGWAILAYNLDTLAVWDLLRHSGQRVSTEQPHEPDSAAPHPGAAVSSLAFIRGK